ncbi:MAG: hypothetical protein PHH01_03825 [Patescibacteria group bacterium]|nr:hypothetical protein [Patescibacteria group bacterium]
MRNLGVILLVCFALSVTCCVSTTCRKSVELPIPSAQPVSPLALNYGSVSLGSSNTLQLMLYNPTTTVVTTTVRSSSNHYVVGLASIMLQPQETSLLTITYNPTKHGKHKSKIQFGSKLFTTVKCVGRCGKHEPTRDKYQWPYASDSPWNTPIGSQAVYVPAGLQPSLWIDIDKDYIYFNGRERPLYANNGWPATCEGDEFLTNVYIADGEYIPCDGKNNSSAFVLPGNIVYQSNPTARCDPTGPVYTGWKAPTENLLTQGIGGGHGGSLLATLGGTIRRGELFGSTPIRHALKLDIWAGKYCSKSEHGFRWPAFRADAYAAKEYDQFGTANRSVRMGALLALPREVDLGSLGLKTVPAKKIAQALRDYGAYIVDDSYWDVFYICVENGVERDFEAHSGFPIAQQSGDWYDDMMKLMTLLCVVDNNSPTTVGGGGTPLTKLAPPFGN